MKKKRIKSTFAAWLVIAVALMGCAASLEDSTAAKVSTMEGYVSRYNPGHTASKEAWEMAQADGGAVVLDLRSAQSYAERHVAGAVNVEFESLEAYAASALPDKTTTIICYCFCGDKGGSALSAYDLLTELGYTNVFYTEPGDEWTYEGEPAAGTQSEPERKIVTGEEAKVLYESSPDAILLDVRNRDEYDEKHIEGSILIPVAELEERLLELPGSETVIIVYCRSGVRSEMAAGILLSAGHTSVYDMQKVDNWPLPLLTK